MFTQLQEDSPRIILKQIDEALGGVIELHQPIEDKDTEALLCKECTSLSPVAIRYPCATVKVIQARLL